jgi:thiosulfate dehydrogenase (quinone) large subunit
MEQDSRRNYQIAFALFRITTGVDMLMHGAMRIPNLTAFVNTTAKLFEGSSPLPMWLVRGFLYFLPFPETIIGVLLILGLFTRGALIVGAITMIILVFGTGTRQDWNTIGLQMAYVFYYYLLIARIEDNWLAIDTRRA